jgi:hypothetical protein
LSFDATYKRCVPDEDKDRGEGETNEHKLDPTRERSAGSSDTAFLNTPGLRDERAFLVHLRDLLAVGDLAHRAILEVTQDEFDSQRRVDRDRRCWGREFPSWTSACPKVLTHLEGNATEHDVAALKFA